MEEHEEETKKLRKRTRMSMCSTRTTFSRLPTEMKDKVLLSVPVKTLFRLRCVIRDYSRFHNPNFIKMHLNQQFELENTSTSTIIMATACRIYKVDLHSFSNPQIPLDIPFLKPTVTSQMKFVGSCNGLLCLTHREGDRYIVHLWNPATGEFKELPEHYYCTGKKSYTCPVLGLGYDHVSGNYKVLAQRKIGRKKVEAIVYTLGTITWRSIGELKYPLKNERSQVFGGCPHWIVRDLKSIVSFSVENEKFQEIPTPPIDIFARPSYLTALGGRLSVFYAVPNQKITYELWVRIDDGLENNTTWTKQLSCSPSDIPYTRQPWGFKNCKVLIGGCGTGGPALFNPMNGDVRALRFQGNPLIFQICSYTESLGMFMVEEDREDVYLNSIK